MNHLKGYSVSRKCYNFMTYADNFATGYFKKQGFTMKITMPKTSTHGYMKDYDGGTPMQCELVPGIDYVNLCGMLEKQRSAVRAQIQLRETSRKVFPGLRVFEEGGTFIAIEDIKGVVEAGWKADDELDEQASLMDIAKEKALHTWFRTSLREVRSHEDKWPFTDPVNPVQVPDYYDVVKDPVDLKMIAERIKEKYYATKEAFVNDFTKMFDNCRKYNAEGTEFCLAADRLQQYCRTVFAKPLGGY